jgi:large subunit ribosomal protein L29
MAEILELRDMSDEKLEELLEDRREEMFNYRFQRASGRLEDYTRLKRVRREIAQIETVLHQRWLAVELAAQEPTVAPKLAGQEWTGMARFSIATRMNRVKMTMPGRFSLKIKVARNWLPR